MKAKIILGLFLSLIIHINSFGQYELYDLQFQLNMQKAFNKVETKHSYTCFDGEHVECFMTIGRLNGFSEVSANIQNRERTIRKDLIVDRSNPIVVMVIVGSKEWELSYGDRITINYDGNVQTLDVGIDDNYSVAGWNEYVENLKKSSVKQPTVVVPVDPIPGIEPNNDQKLKRETCSSCNGKRVSLLQLLFQDMEVPHNIGAAIAK